MGSTLLGNRTADGPAVAERVAELPVAVAPELILEQHDDGRTGIHRALPPLVGVLHLEVDSNALRWGCLRATTKFGEVVRQENSGAVHAKARVHDAFAILAIGT